MIEKIRKRDGREILFSPDKITRAIFLAASSVAKRQGKDVDYDEAERLCDQVVSYLNKEYIDTIPDVEQVQDIVVRVLIENGHVNTSQEYILYRNERSKARNLKSRLMQSLIKINELESDDTIDNSLNGKIFRSGLAISKEYNQNILLKPEYYHYQNNKELFINNLAYINQGCLNNVILKMNDIFINKINSNIDLVSIYSYKDYLIETIYKIKSEISGYLIIDDLKILLDKLYVSHANTIIEDLNMIVDINYENITSIEMLDDSYPDYIKESCENNIYEIIKSILISLNQITKICINCNDKKLLEVLIKIKNQLNLNNNLYFISKLDHNDVIKLDYDRLENLLGYGDFAKLTLNIENNFDDDKVNELLNISIDIFNEINTIVEKKFDNNSSVTTKLSNVENYYYQNFVLELVCEDYDKVSKIFREKINEKNLKYNIVISNLVRNDILKYFNKNSLSNNLINDEIKIDINNKIISR